MANGEKNCPYCGEMIRSEAIKCRHCGEMLEERPRSSSPPGRRYPDRADRLPPEPGNATTIFVLGLLGILVCGILGIVAFFMGRTYKEQVAQGLVRRNGLADAGYILGMISMILIVVGLFFFIIMILGAGLSSM